jgi:hypothetical protein
MKKRGKIMKGVRVEIDIQASAEKVWAGSLDLEMPRFIGYEKAPLIKEQLLAPRMIILSDPAGRGEQLRTRAAGTDSFMKKGDRFEAPVDANLSGEYPPNPETPEKGTKS